MQNNRELQIKQGLIAQQKVINSLFGDKAKSDKFLATASKVANDYKLANCNVNSIIDACVTVAQLNLDLSPALSHCYLVPFKQNIQLIISARGYVALLARTGWKVKSYIVNEGDRFEYNVNGFDEHIIFEKNIDNDKEIFKYAVALAQAPDGTLFVEIMNKNQIEKHRKVSANQKGVKPSGVWADWYDEMASKTVIKKLIKKLPIGEDVAEVVVKDDVVIEAQTIEMPKKEVVNVDLNDLAQGQDLLENTEIEVSDPVTGEVMQNEN